MTDGDLPVLRPSRGPPAHVGEMPSWSPVEIEMGVSSDAVMSVGGDLATGQPRIKVELARRRNGRVGCVD
jgi:hypothetical protein